MVFFEVLVDFEATAAGIGKVESEVAAMNSKHVCFFEQMFDKYNISQITCFLTSSGAQRKPTSCLEQRRCGRYIEKKGYNTNAS